MEVLTLSVREAAKKLGVGQNAMYAACKSGGVRTLHVGRKRRVPVVELEALAREPERFSARAGKGGEA